MKYYSEQSKIESALGSDIYTVLRESGAMLAGGAITSIFTNREINDFDIYFKNYEGMWNFLREIYVLNEGQSLGPYDVIVNFMTDRSILCKVKDHPDTKIQLIVYREFPSVESIFESFDFTINMGAFDFKSEEFHLHRDFLKHNSQRYLSFNSGTSFPLISALRVQKYVDRGYTISKAQFLKILMAVNKLEIDSWEKFADHIAGMYGLDPNEVFDYSKGFSLDEAVAQLETVILPESKKGAMCPTFDDVVKRYTNTLDEDTKKWHDAHKGVYCWNRALFDNSKFQV